MAGMAGMAGTPRGAAPVAVSMAPVVVQFTQTGSLGFAFETDEMDRLTVTEVVEGGQAQIQHHGYLQLGQYLTSVQKEKVKSSKHGLKLLTKYKNDRPLALGLEMSAAGAARAAKLGKASSTPGRVTGPVQTAPPGKLGGTKAASMIAKREADAVRAVKRPTQMMLCKAEDPTKAKHDRFFMLVEHEDSAPELVWSEKHTNLQQAVAKGKKGKKHTL